MTAVGIIAGCAARHLRTGVDYTEAIEVQAVWPESLSADALQVGCLLAFAIVGMFKLDATHLEAVAGGIMPEV